MSNEPLAKANAPTVLIVGAGLGGLMLAALLEQLKVPYRIFERAVAVKPLEIDEGESHIVGSAMTLGPGILSVFEQIGIFEDLRKISLPVRSMEVYDTTMKELGSVNLREHKDMPELYKLMLKQAPAHKISMNKKVLRIEESDGRVIIHCADSTTYEGEILVGADGAYSGVRQSLYTGMDEQGLLPKEDLEAFSIGSVVMVGISKPENPEKYPQLQDDFCHFSTTLGKGCRNCPGQQICWSFGKQLTDAESREQQFRSSEWGPEANEAMIKELQDLPCPWGGTMGEIIKTTPRDLISKVFVEEKCFKTWYHGRTLLMGDDPPRGWKVEMRALSAMQDAVVLANGIYNMPDLASKSITTAFQKYYNQRYSRTLNQFNQCRTMSKVMYGQRWIERFLRTIILGYIPHWVQQRSTAKNFAFKYRPQVAWLPLVENAVL